MKTKLIIIITICYILFSYFSVGYALTVGDTVPEIYGITINDDNFILSMYNGKLRLINFFSTNCKPCEKELPDLALLENEMPDIMIIAICVGNLNKTNVRKFIKKLSKAPKLVVCSGDFVKNDYGFHGLPHSVIIDKQGRVLKIIPGYNIKIIKKTLQKLRMP